jgi:branched-chain amino acid transport system ATP-binding protein
MALLELRDVHTWYGAIHALRGVSLSVDEGEIVGLIGPNGAGKSTTLRTISGLIRPRQGEISLRGQRIDGRPPHEIVQLGVCQSPEGRRVFPRMSVHENLELGAFSRKGQRLTDDFARVFDLFPRLRERRSQKAGTLSGGEQQMLAIGRALMARPRLLMLDEPSLGLAPLLVQEIFGYIRDLKDEVGLTVLVVEQNARRALEVADHGYILERGRIVLEGTAAELKENPDVKEFYLGLGDSGRKNYREVKHYKRRKRWL